METEKVNFKLGQYKEVNIIRTVKSSETNGSDLYGDLKRYRENKMTSGSKQPRNR